MEKHGTARTIPLKLRHSGQVNGKVLLTCDTEAFTHAFPWARPGDDVVVLGLDIKPEGENRDGATGTDHQGLPRG